jgi:hypothetical protein
MPDLTGGYLGDGRGNTGVLDVILAHPGVTWKGPAGTLAHELFTKNFMPYAKAHWAYHGSQCNCEHLARAFHATWNYVGHKRKSTNPREVLPKAGVDKCFGAMGRSGGMITRALAVFSGPAHGNVRNPTTNALDGRCLFPVHYLCQVGSRYFDPTFDRETAVRDDCVERKLDKLGLTLWLCKDGTRLYERNETPAPAFSDSWNEFNANDWVTYAQWKDLTARSGHWRSSQLKAVDGALEAYEGTKNPNNLTALKTAFQKWYTNNKAEVTHRNKESCINRLALNLGLAKELLK